jgi:hypothetical protein
LNQAIVPASSRRHRTPRYVALAVVT